MARRLGELPETAMAFDSGELGEDQVAVVCRHAPASIDAEAATLARSATVVQLRRVLGSYAFAEGSKEPAARSEPRSVSFATTEHGTWPLSAELPVDEGAAVERALVAAGDELFRAGEHDKTANPRPAHVDWADAFVAMAERSLGGAMRPCHERNLVLLHVDTDGQRSANAYLHLGTGINHGLRRFLGCDARIRAVFESGGRPVSVGRAFRSVPDRTRIVIEDRDRGCRVPGCDRGSDTENLIALCHRHHRLHHLGRLGIVGNADDPEGIHFTDERGRTLDPTGRPVAPSEPSDVAARGLGIPAGVWSHPTAERLDPHWVHFNERAS